MKDKIQLLQKFAENVPGVIYQFQLFPDGRNCFPYASQSMLDICGVCPSLLVTDGTPVFAQVIPEHLPQLMLSIDNSAREMIDWSHEFQLLNGRGELRWIYGYSRPEKKNDGSTVWHGFLNDITERKKLEEEYLKASRLHHLYGKINSMIIHAEDHERLFEEACQIVVQEGNFNLAWIGLIDPFQKSIRPVKSFGDSDNFLNEIGVIRYNKPQLGPIGLCVLENRIMVSNDLTQLPEFVPWKVAALQRDLLSNISLPLVVNGITIGCLNIYSNKTNFFNEREIELLSEISHNVSYAIGVIDKGQALIKSEQSFRTIFEEAPLGIAVIDSRSGAYQKINSKFLEILGRNVDELASMNWMTATHPDDLQKDLDTFDLLKSGNVASFQMKKRLIHSSGRLAWVEVSVVPLYASEVGSEQYLCMVEDISERVRYEDELHAALKVRDEFLSIASHELKTPITSLKLQIQLLLRNIQKSSLSGPPVDHSKSLEMASRQTDRLTFLVDNLLDVTRIGSGQFNVNLIEFNLSQILLDTLERCHGLFLEAGCVVEKDITPDILGYWDQGRLEQVMVNLISNAVKYAPGKPVRVQLFQEDQDVILKVTDHGPGLTMEDKQRIFNQFERIHSSLNISGLGLGLYISKKIVDTHRGEIFVESESDNGTTFTVKLPLK